MATDSTTGDLFMSKTITDDEVNAAVNVFMRDVTVSLFRSASGYTQDPATAVKARDLAGRAIIDSAVTKIFGA